MVLWQEIFRLTEKEGFLMLWEYEPGINIVLHLWYFNFLRDPRIQRDCLPSEVEVTQFVLWCKTTCSSGQNILKPEICYSIVQSE